MDALSPVIALLVVLFLLKPLLIDTDSIKKRYRSSPHYDEIEVGTFEPIVFEDVEKGVNLEVKILKYSAFNGVGCGGGDGVFGVTFNSKYKFKFTLNDTKHNDPFYSVSYILPDNTEVSLFAEGGFERWGKHSFALSRYIQSFGTHISFALRFQDTSDTDGTLEDYYYNKHRVYRPLMCLLYAHGVINEKCEYILSDEKINNYRNTPHMKTYINKYHF